MEDEIEPRVVTSVGVAATSPTHGVARARRIEKAMSDAVLKCNEEGISTAEENSAKIQERMFEARRLELELINAEEAAATDESLS